MVKKILIVDDESDICEVLSKRLQQAGFQTIIAYDGEEALRKAAQEKPDLIILDLMLPKIPGEEVCKKIKNNAETCAIPIIMLTAKASDVDRVIGRVIGADSYIMKPYKANELLQEINRFIKK